MKIRGFFFDCRSVVAQISSGQGLTATQRLGGFSHNDAVHDDAIALREVGGDKFMLGGDFGDQFEIGAGIIDGVTFSQIGKGDQHVVSRINL